MWSGFFCHTCQGVKLARGERNSGEGSQLLPHRPVVTDSSQLRRLPGSQVPGLKAACHKAMMLPLMTNCVRPITSAICFHNRHRTLCVRNYRNARIISKILTEKNQQAFIITEEQLLTAFASGELHGKPEQPLSRHIVCVSSCNNSASLIRNQKCSLSFLQKS